MADYQHLVTDGSGNTREVFPMEWNSNSLQSKRKLSDGQVFYRVSMRKPLVFINDTKKGIDDYDFFIALERDATRRCEILTYVVNKYCDGSFRELWRGFVVASKGSYDLDQCHFSVTPEINDRYNCVLREWEREQNILDQGYSVNTAVNILPDYEYQMVWYDAGADKGEVQAYALWYVLDNTPPGLWQMIYHNASVRSSCGLINSLGVFARQFTYTVCSGGIGGTPNPPSGTGWNLEEDDCAVSGLCKWTRYPQGFSQQRNVAQDYINVGSCTGSFGTMEEQPPPKVFLDVTVRGANPTPTTTRIWGYNSGCAGRYEFKVLEHMSTSAPDFTWSFSGPAVAGLSVVSGSGTDTIVVDVLYPGGGAPQELYVDCQITTHNGSTFDCDQFTFYVTSGYIHLSEGLPSDEGLLLHERQLCIGETAVRFYYPRNHNSTSISIGIGHLDPPSIGGLYEGTDYTIAAGGNPLDGYVDIDFDPSLKPDLTASNGAFWRYYRLRVTVAGSSNTGPYPYSCTWYNRVRSDEVYIKYLPNTSRIYGCDDIETGGEGDYYVDNRSGATYEWEVDGGVILSGQGTNAVTVRWTTGAGNTGCLSVKEHSNSCCPQLIPLAECDAEGHPPVYWCIVSTASELSTGKWLIGSIEWMLQQVCGDGLLVQSDFFEWAPLGDAPNYVAGENYVTGLANQLRLLTIHQKSDVITPNASNPATKGIWTLKKAFEVLREMFQVYWFVTQAGNLRLEHITYFDFATQLDLTLSQYARQLKALNKYEHKNNEFPKFERFRWMEADGLDFVGADIEYDDPCVTADEDHQVKEYAPEQITTDVEFIVNSPNDIDKDGFVILANEDDGASGYETIIDLGVLSNELVTNAPLSWANLHKAFFKTYRYLPNGTMNLIPAIFTNNRPTIKQVPLTIVSCCEYLNFDPRYKVKTELGEQHLNGLRGIVELAEFDIEQETLKLQLEYPYV